MVPAACVLLLHPACGPPPPSAQRAAAPSLPRPCVPPRRDIKPQNLLVNINSHALKLCDFGSAKTLVRGEPNISYICSRYYRAPELIFGATDYTCAIDVRCAAAACMRAAWSTSGVPAAHQRERLPDVACLLHAQVWSVGCVMAELLLGSPLFPGESGVDQLVEIIKVRGGASRVYCRAGVLAQQVGIASWRQGMRRRGG